MLRNHCGANGNCLKNYYVYDFFTFCEMSYLRKEKYFYRFCHGNDFSKILYI